MKNLKIWILLAAALIMSFGCIEDRTSIVPPVHGTSSSSDLNITSFENDCLKQNMSIHKQALVYGLNGIYCAPNDIVLNISTSTVEGGINVTVSVSMINISKLNDTSITIKNPGNATSFDLNLTSNDSSNISIRDTTIYGDDQHCPHYDDPLSHFDPCLNFYPINKNSVCFDKNTTLDFIPQNNLFQFILSYNIENGNFERDIPIRDLSEIKYFCQDLNVTIKR